MDDAGFTGVISSAAGCRLLKHSNTPQGSQQTVSYNSTWSWHTTRLLFLRGGHVSMHQM